MRRGAETPRLIMADIGYSVRTFVLFLCWGFESLIGLMQSFGSIPSKKDERTVKAKNLARSSTTTLPEKFIVPLKKYPLNEMIDQQRIGICTACARTRAQEEYHSDGVRLDEYWSYVMQKVLVDDPDFDGIHFEGSSALTALKTANRYGTPDKTMLEKYPLKVDGTYKEFWDDFKKTYKGKIPKEVLDNATLHKIPGYYQIDITPSAIAKELYAGKVLIIRVDVGDNFYRPSWKAKDLLPLRAPDPVENGHLMSLNGYMYINDNGDIELSGPNSWGTRWCPDNKKYGAGYYYFHLKTYKKYLTEVWAIMDEAPKFKFTQRMKLGSVGPEVVALQKFLESRGYLKMPVGVSYGYFGKLTEQAVIKLQEDHADEILKPVNRTKGTGFVYDRTIQWLNRNQ